MEEASIVHAVERVEAALKRLEAAAQQQADISQRHIRLKTSVSESVQELDRLLGGNSR